VKEATLMIKTSKDEAIAHTNSANAAKLAAGSYNQLTAQYKALLAEYRSTPSNSPLFEKIKQDTLVVKQRLSDLNKELNLPKSSSALGSTIVSGIKESFQEIISQGLQVAGIVLGIHEAFQLIGDSVKEFDKATEASVRLKNSLENVGRVDLFNSLTTQAQKFADTYKRINPADIKDVFTKLIDYGKLTKDQIVSLTDTIINFAAKEHISLQEATTIITQGLEGNSRALKNYGINVKDAHTVAERFAIIQGTLSQKMQGAEIAIENTSKGIRETWAASLSRGKEKLGEFIEGLAGLDEAQQKAAISAKKDADQGNELVKRYEELSGKVHKTTAEKTELHSITNQLIGIFGTSVASIDKETGALILNVNATKELIKQRLLLANSRASELALKFNKGEDDQKANTENTVLLTNALREAEKQAGKTFEEIKKLQFGSTTSARKVAESPNFRKVFDLGTQIEGLQRDRKRIVDELKGLEKDLGDLGFKGSDIDNLFKPTSQTETIGGGDPHAKDAATILKEEEAARRARELRLNRIEENAAADRKIAQNLFNKRKIDEETFNDIIFAIDKNAINEKLKLVQGETRDQLKEKAKLNDEEIKLTNEHNDKLFALIKARLESEKNKQIQDAQSELNRTLEDPELSPLAKAKAELDFAEKKLFITKTFDKLIEEEENEFNKKSIATQTDRKTATEAVYDALHKALFNISKATLDDIDFQTNKSVTELKAKFAKLRSEILTSNLSPSRKSVEVTALNSVQTVAEDAAQLQGDLDKQKAAKTLFDQGKISLAEYDTIIKKVADDQEKLNNSIKNTRFEVLTLKSFIETGLKTSLSKLFNFDITGNEKTPKEIEKKLGLQQTLATTIEDTYNSAGIAMNTYFDMEQNRIDASLKLQQKKLDSELDIAKRGAQTLAEKDSLDRQFKAKKEALDKEAFEKSKKIQIAQAEVNLGIQLSNLAVIAFAPNPLNIATLGTAGAIMYAIQAALALVNFAFTVNKIKSAQFEQGGSLSDVLDKGGEFGGRSHAQGGNKFLHKGNLIETEAREAYVINKNATQSQGIFTVTGTPRQIASAINTIGGGRPFDIGARLYRKFEYGGLLGENVQAPHNPGSFLNPGSINRDSLDELKAMTAIIHNSVIATNNRIDRLEVIQVTKTVQNALKKQVKNDNINSI
jgi:hypothetical protein